MPFGNSWPYLDQALSALLHYCRSNSWAGHDPYDALNSALFNAIPCSDQRLPRLAFTQLMKRCPVNLRPFLKVPRQQNPKGIALFCSAFVALARNGVIPLSEVATMANTVLSLRSAGYPESCWGYNFPWQTRTYLVPRGTPNIICTTFAGNALLDAYDLCGTQEWLDAAASAGRFLLTGLNRTTSSAGSCFSYTPLDDSRIHNANLLGAAFLARLCQYQPASEFKHQALSSTRFSSSAQRPDGSWFYGETPRQRWIDSFHTGYNLTALQTIQRHLPEANVTTAIDKGLTFYLAHFLTREGHVKYYHDRTYPIDVHAVAHAIVTIVEFADSGRVTLEAADRIVDWSLRNLYDDAGFFYYQKWPGKTVKISYMRWGQAWMLLALSKLSLARSSLASTQGAQAQIASVAAK